MITWLRHLKLRLTPLQELQSIGMHGRRYWRATGSDPAFTVDWRPRPGWYLVSTHLDYEGPPVSAALCGAVLGAALPGPGVWLGISVVIGGLAVGLAVGLPPDRLPAARPLKSPRVRRLRLPP